MSTGALCGDGPHIELIREPDRVRWCFGCREHLPHDFVVRGPAGPSWYGPNPPEFVCHRCGHDRTVGFGAERVWDA